MLNKKVMILAILAVSLLAVSVVSAADNATDDIADIEKQDDITADADNDLLKTNPKTFSDLYKVINNGSASEIYLNDDYKFNNDTDSYYKNGIYIKHAMTIYGNGSTIDGSGAARIFMVYDNIGDVTIKDITFVNAKTPYEGGAIKGKATAINCVFNNNSATKNGGATYGQTTAINCTFTNNTAGWGGAMYQGRAINCTFEDNYAEVGAASAYGHAVNCSFTNNRADDRGGAMYGPSCSAENCNFTQNRALNGGAIYGATSTARKCTFTRNIAGECGGAMFFGTAGDCTFISNHAPEGGAIYNDGKSVENCIFKNNTADIGGAAYQINATGCQFTGNSAGENGGAVYGGIVVNSNFTHNRAKKNGGAVCDGLVSDCLFEYNCATFGGAVCAIKVADSTFNNNEAIFGGAVCNAKVSTSSRFYNNTLNDTCNVTFYDAESTGSFTQLNQLLNTGESVIYLGRNYTYDFTVDSAFSDGILIDHDVVIYGNGFTLDGESTARIFQVTGNNVVFRDIVFVNAYTEKNGGAISGNSTAINCTFRNNKARFGGAMYVGSAVNCLFVENTAESGCGGAMSVKCHALNCIFIDNHADGNSGGAMHAGSAENCIFTGNTAKYGGAINECNVMNSTFIANNASQWGGVGYNGTFVNCLFFNNTAIEGGAMYLGYADSCIFKSSSDTTVDSIIIKPNFTVSNFTSVYNSGDKLTFSLTTKDGMPALITVIEISIYKNSIPVGNYSCLSDEGWIPELDAGSYAAVFNACDYNVTSNATLTIKKMSSKITSSSVTTVYNGGKYLYVTLKDADGNPIANAKITVNIKGEKTIKTDKNGKAKLTTNAYAPKTYTAKITFNGNTNYAKSTKSVKVTVKKATPKLTAKAKKFKKSVKTKKYSITLKTNKNKVMKNKKVKLKVNKKTYTAKTNKKGVATFKIKNLKKKGTFKATVTYKGNSYYKKVTKKVKIKCK